MKPTLLVDTNVLLDVLANREPWVHAARQIWSLAESRAVTAYIAAISFNNCYYIVRKYGGRARADEAMRMLRAVFEPVELSTSILDRAIAAGFADFEDAIQLFSAKDVGASTLVTRDPDDFPEVGFDVLAPTEFLARRALTDPGTVAG